MSQFSVIILTAAPIGQAAEAGGAFVKIDGREALLRSIELFLNRDPVKQIQAVFVDEIAQEAKQKHGAHLSFSGVKTVVAGPGWMDQLAGAAGHVDPDATHVIIHDAARPAVPYTDIEAILAAADQHDAVALATPLASPVIAVDPHGNPTAYHRSDEFMALLTPQVFSRDKFNQMVAGKQQIPPADLKLIKGSPLNRRLSGPGDAKLVKAMLNMLPVPRKGALGAFEEAQW